MPAVPDPVPSCSEGRWRSVMPSLWVPVSTCLSMRDVLLSSAHGLAWACPVWGGCSSLPVNFPAEI